jgi:hypothetical protein
MGSRASELVTGPGGLWRVQVEDVRLKLVELARHWIHAALIEERTARQPAMTSLLRQLNGLNTSSRSRELLRTPIQGQ